MKKGMFAIIALLITAFVFASEWTEIDKLLASDFHSCYDFGYAVDISGDYAIIGSPAHTNGGAAYIFYHSDSGWVEQAILQASDTSRYFGRSVAISHDRVIIGASIDNDGGQCAGAAYIFCHYDNRWHEEAKLVANDAGAYDYFGRKVCIQGPHAIVNASSDDEDENGENYLNSSGSAYYFYFNGSQWTQQQKIVAETRRSMDRFGASISFFGNYLLISKANDFSNPGNEGCVCVFKFNGNQWTQIGTLEQDNPSDNNYFGHSISMSEYYALVGAANERDYIDGEPHWGFVYLYFRQGDEWTLIERMHADTLGGKFGCSVDLYENNAIIGASVHSYDTDKNYIQSAGAAYIYKHDINGWQFQNKVTASDRDYMNHFGDVVSISRDHALVGCYEKDVAGVQYSDRTGAAYIFAQQITAPISIADQATHISANTAILNGVVDNGGGETIVTFEYDTCTAYAQSILATQSPIQADDDSTNVSIELTGLIPSSDYYYRIKTVNSAAITYSESMSFTTLSGDPYVSTGPVTDIDSSSAHIRGIVYANGAEAEVIIEYGSDLSYGDSVFVSQSPLAALSDTTDVSVTLSGLDPVSTYHYRIKAVTSEATRYGEDSTFTTLAKMPVCYTGNASEIDSNQVVLNAVVYSGGTETRVCFEYGTTSSYGDSMIAIQSPIVGSDSTQVNASISGLKGSTMYHYRVKSVNSTGVAYGQDKTFTTLETSIDLLDDSGFRVEAAYPNPFNPTVTINYHLSSDNNVRAFLYNSKGTLVDKLLNCSRSAGSHHLVWDASHMPSGLYFLHMMSGNNTNIQKLVLLK